MNTDRGENKEFKFALKKRPDSMTAAAVIFLAAALFVSILDGAKSNGDSEDIPAESAVSESRSETFSVLIIPATGSTTRTVTSVSSKTSKKAVPAAVSVTSKTAGTSKTSAETSAPKTSTVKKTTAPTTTATSAATAQTTQTTAAATETETSPPETSVSEITTASTVSTTVPTTSVTTTTTTTALVVSFPADINKLTYEELLNVPGIGEKIAGDIVYLRERSGTITDMEQLLELYGIGEEKLRQLKEYLFVSDSDYRPITQSTVITTVSETISVTETEPPSPERKPVNLNTADADEIADCLLISYEKAAAIVSIREMIGGFTSPDELRLVSGLTESDLKEISAYVLI